MASELNNEYMRRFNHENSYLSITKLGKMINEFGLPKLPDIDRTEFAQAMPEEYRSKDIVEAYRRYYIEDKQHLADWKNSKPDWFVIK